VSFCITFAIVNKKGDCFWLVPFLRLIGKVLQIYYIPRRNPN